MVIKTTSQQPGEQPKRSFGFNGWPYLVIISVALGLMMKSGCAESSAPAPPAPPESAAEISDPAPNGELVSTSLEVLQKPQEPATSEGEKQKSEKSDATPESSKHELDEKSNPGVLGQASRFLEQAKNKTGQTASGASRWVQERMGGAADAGTQTADEMWEWANQTYDSLKSQGLTTAKDTSDWLSQDWKNIESWEYKIVTLAGTDEEMTRELNALGTVGWECFNSEIRDDGRRFYFKKPKFSYLRQLPFKDVIKLVPMMNQGN